MFSYGTTTPKKSGFRMTDGFNIRKEVHTWDKALFFFSTVVQSYYEFVWLIEYDVFIPTLSAFTGSALMHTLYANKHTIIKHIIIRTVLIIR